MIDLIQAILVLDPNAKVAVNNIDAITWYDGNPNNITKEQIQAKYNELVEADKKIQYQRDRSSEYPSWQEQMDMQYHDAVNGTTTWQEAIEAVKTKYPKGE